MTLYRLYSRTRFLLYVGITKNVDVRLKQHARDKSWWHLVHVCETQEFDDAWDAAIAETRAIGAEWPLFNRTGHPVPIWSRAVANEPGLIPLIEEVWAVGDLNDTATVRELVGWRRTKPGPEWLFSVDTYECVCRVLNAVAA